MKQIYLDHNATTKIHDDVAATMADCFRSGYVNPASQHASGRAARAVLEHARDTIAEILGARTAAHAHDQVIFTSGGTEANNLALFGLAGQSPGRIIVSAIEHPSVLAAAARLAQLGCDVQHLRVLPNGVCDLDHFNELLNADTKLVSVMLANNETGVIQPVKEIAELCLASNIPFHCDAAQAVGKIPVSFWKLNAAAMTIAPHKFHGPCGIGILLVRHDVTLQPLLFGGSQQFGVRPGTECVAAAVGAAKALEIWQADLGRQQRMETLRERLESRIRAEIPDCVIVGEQSHRLPHTTNLAFRGVDRQAFLMAIDIAGVAISTGSACASGSSEPSHVLIAMNCHPEVVDGALRISLGALTTADEIDLAAGHIIRTAKDLGARHSS